MQSARRICATSGPMHRASGAADSDAFSGGSVLLTLGVRSELFSLFANVSAVTTKQRGVLEPYC